MNTYEYMHTLSYVALRCVALHYIYIYIYIITYT